MEFWKLNLRIGVIKIKLWQLETWKLFKNGSFENWNFGHFFEKLEFWKLNLRIRILEIKFKNWNSEELFKDGILKINK